MEKELLIKVGNTSIYLKQGDICQTPTDAIITPINSGGMWYGGIDGAIQRVAGNLYHSQAEARMPLKNLQTVVARGIPGDINHGLFRDVVFVIDDLQSPLEEVVYTGLEAANVEGYERILLPTMRMGVMSGVVEKTPQEAVDRMSIGVKDFLNKYGSKTKIKELGFVVYLNPEIANMFRKS
jgi:hypothetical protein